MPSFTGTVCMYNLLWHKSDEALGFWILQWQTSHHNDYNTMLIYRARWKELVKDGMTRYQLSLNVIFKNFPHV